MSTKERYGTAVWDAIVALHMALSDDAWGWHRVGEIAKKAGVSRPTARKYLEGLYEMGHVRVIKDGSAWYYQPFIN
jgi:Mn-dependent DtxR family transcriptional regulator